MQQEIIKKNNINIIGNGTQVLLLVHGYGCDQNMWRFITPAFTQNYKIVLIDLVGSGKSDINAYNFQKYSSIKGYADDIIEICETFDFKDVILVGHSVSAMIAGLATIKKPNLFKKLIMVCPSPRYVNDDGYVGGFSQADIDGLVGTLNDNYLGWSSAIAPVIIGNPSKPEFADELANSFCKNDPTIAKHFAEVTFTGDNREDLKYIDLPTLIIQCQNDVIAPLQVGDFVHKEIKNSTLVVLKSMGHCPHLTSPEVTIAAIADFL